MKGVIFYHSTTGNTKLLCESVASQIQEVSFELRSISAPSGLSPEDYDIVGFATFADEFQIPVLMKEFIERHGVSSLKDAFLINTYGSMPGRTLLDMARACKRNGYLVGCAVSIHTPENYPPLLRAGMGFENQPSKKRLVLLTGFVRRLRQQISDIAHRRPRQTQFLGILPYLFPQLPRFLSRFQFGDFLWDSSRCNRCSLCVKRCPAKAIFMNGIFVVNRELCQDCWKCYNLCPAKAIHGSRFTGDFQYSQVHKNLRRKLQEWGGLL